MELKDMQKIIHMKKITALNFSDTVEFLLKVKDEHPDKANVIITEAFEKGYLTFDKDAIHSMKQEEIKELSKKVNALLDFITEQREEAKSNLHKIKTYQKARSHYNKHA